MQQYNKTIQKMINIDGVTKENMKEDNVNWSQIPDHPYRILIIGGSGSGKANPFFNLTNKQPDIDKTYLYAKDTYEAKYQFLSDKRESTDLKHFNGFKAFIKYSNEIDDIFKTVKNTTQVKKVKY